MKKRNIIICLIIFLILLFIFIKFEYKNLVSGNNINKSDKNNILNISSYEATVTLEIHSNKNTNKYVMKQEFKKPDIFSQEVIEPAYLKGLTIKNEGSNITVENKNLELKTLYEDFSNNISNLSLISFVNNYKKEIENSIKETEKETIMETKIEKNNNITR